jgi:hypothetical protein
LLCLWRQDTGNSWSYFIIWYWANIWTFFVDVWSIYWSNVVFTRSLKIAEALEVQMDVQKKLYKQIEVALYKLWFMIYTHSYLDYSWCIRTHVNQFGTWFHQVQKHLQFRIEAQGKYLQSVLMKAHEALSRYSSSSTTGVEHAKSFYSFSNIYRFFQVLLVGLIFMWY